MGILRAFSRKMVANESQNNFAIFFPEKGRILHFAVGRRAQGARRFLPKAEIYSSKNRIPEEKTPFFKLWPQLKTELPNLQNIFDH